MRICGTAAEAIANVIDASTVRVAYREEWRRRYYRDNTPYIKLINVDLELLGLMLCEP